MISYSIYVVDDEPSIREGITMALEMDFQVKSFSNAEDAIRVIRDEPPDLVLLDVGLPGMDGIKALAEIKKHHPDLLVIMITAYEDVNTVISAMKQGVYDYVLKPLHMESLEVTIRNGLETIKLRKEVKLLQEQYLQENLPCFMGESSAIHDVMEFISMVAKSPDTPVLILGETGTGKELIAGAIHYRSPNFKGPLVTVNCAAIPKDLIESELFGYEKGAFSGAGSTGKKGLVEEADNGTLFLDEVGDLSMEAQAKLLRFLEQGEFYRIGSTRKNRIQTRILSATNKNLTRMMEEGLFRKDLYFRLGVIKVLVPSLNERCEDILPLARYFLVELNQKFGKNITTISAGAESALLSHVWTGNVRELKNIIERAVLTSTGSELMVRNLGLENMPKNETGQTPETSFPRLTPKGLDLDSAIKTMERFYFEEALKSANGNESKAARLLNMNHHTFRYRRKKLLSE